MACRIPVGVALDEVIGGTSASTRNATVYLTGFGGHEQMLLAHLATSSLAWRLSVIAESPAATHELRERLPSNVSVVSEINCAAYPKLKSIGVFSAALQAWRVAGNLPRPDLVSSGDIGNFYLVTASLAIRGCRLMVYAPMAPRRPNAATRIARRAISRLITISEPEALKFAPHADVILRNMAPGHLQRLRRGPPQDFLEVFWIGRFDEMQKQPSMALRIADELSRRHPYARIHLNFIGDGPDLRAAREYAASANLGDRVRFWGWIDFTKLTPTALPPIHALLNTSNYEGVPLTMLDALESGIPCVFRKGAVQDAEYSGRLIEWTSPAEGAAALVGLHRATGVRAQ